MIEAIAQLTRPVTTMGLVAALIYLTIIGRIGGEQYFTVVTMVVGFWFGNRALAAVTTPNGAPTNGNGAEVKP